MTSAAIHEPYIGLRPYEEREHSLFFGRDRDKQLLQNKIYSAPLTILYAPSGVGKTSLLKTLLIPGLRNEGDGVLYVDQWRHEDPYATLKRNLCGHLSARVDSEDQTKQSLVDILRSHSAHTESTSFIMVLDQFEQILVGTEPAANLGHDLAMILSSGLNIHVVISLREEFLAKLQVFREYITNLFNSTYRLEHLKDAGAREAIEGPGREFKPRFTVDQELTSTLLRDLAVEHLSAGAVSSINPDEGIDLPVMQIVCQQLWRGSDRLNLSLGLYNQMGRRDGIIKDYLDSITSTLSHDAREQAAEVIDQLAPASGIKMSYPIDILSKNTKLPEKTIAGMLQHWQRMQVVREREIGKALAYELNHDAFIKVIRPWSDQILKAKRKRIERELAARKARKWIFATIGACIACLVFAAALVLSIESRHRGDRARTLAMVVARGGVNPTTAAAALREVIHAGMSHSPWVQWTLDRAVGEDPPRDLTIAATVPLRESLMYRTQIQASGNLRSTTFVPEKQRIVGITEDWKATVWDLSGVQTAVFDGASLGAGAPVSFVCVAPDLLSAMIAYGDGSALFVNAHKQVTGRFKTHPGQINFAAFSPDGSTLVTAGTGGAAMWSRDGALLKRLGASTPVAYAILSPTGARIAVASNDGSVSLWDGSGNLVSKLRLPSAESQRSPTQLQTGTFASRAPYSMTFSPDGATLAATWSDGSVSLWKRDGASTSKHQQAQYAIFSSNSKLVMTSSWYGDARLWDVESGQPDGFVVNAPSGPAAIAPDGNAIVTTSSDGGARLWSRGGRLLAKLAGKGTEVVTYAGIDDAGTIVTSWNDGTIRVWNRSGVPVPTLALAPADGDVPAVTQFAAFSPDGRRIVATFSNGAAWLWDRENKSDPIPLSGHRKSVTYAEFSSDGDEIITASEDGTARIFSIKGEPIATLETGASAIAYATQSPNKDRAVTVADGGAIKLWTRNGLLMKELQALRRAPEEGASDFAIVAPAQFNSSGTMILTVSSDGSAEIWSGEGKYLRRLGDLAIKTTHAVFAPTGDAVLTASADGKARLWGLDGKLQQQGYTDQVQAPIMWHVAFSHDGRMILTTHGDGTARLWNRNSPIKPIAKMAGPKNFPVVLGLLNTHGQVLTYSSDNVARLWTGRGILLGEFHGAETTPDGRGDDSRRRRLGTATFDAAGDMIVTTSNDAGPRLWAIAPKTLLANLEQTALPCLDNGERQIYFPESMEESSNKANSCTEEKRTTTR